MARIDLLQEHFVGPGEQRTHTYLQSSLPDDWFGVALKEVVVSADYMREADFVLVGKNAVFVVEEKSWTGEIFGTDTWWYVNRRERTSPINQSESVAKALAGVLRRQFPSLSSENRLVVGAVIFSDKRAHVNLHASELRGERILSITNAAERLIALDRRNKYNFSLVSRENVAARLGLLPRRRIPKQIGPYEIVESLPPAGPAQNWRARNTITEEERFLRAIPLSTTRLDVEQRTPVLREYQVYRKELSDLAQCGCIPLASDPFTFEDSFWIFPFQIPPGRSLLDVDARQLSPGRLLSFVKSAFQLLMEIHRRGVLHRNLSPERILMSADGKPVFTDFLIARIDGERTIASTAWRVDTISEATAPELLEAVDDATEASDVYSLSFALRKWLNVDPTICGHKELHPGDDNAICRAMLKMELERGVSASPHDRPSAADIACSL